MNVRVFNYSTLREAVKRVRFFFEENALATDGFSLPDQPNSQGYGLYVSFTNHNIVIHSLDSALLKKASQKHDDDCFYGLTKNGVWVIGFERLDSAIGFAYLLKRLLSCEIGKEVSVDFASPKIYKSGLPV